MARWLCPFGVNDTVRWLVVLAVVRVSFPPSTEVVRSVVATNSKEFGCLPGSKTQIQGVKQGAGRDRASPQSNARAEFRHRRACMQKSHSILVHFSLCVLALPHFVCAALLYIVYIDGFTCPLGARPLGKAVIWRGFPIGSSVR